MLRPQQLLGFGTCYFDYMITVSLVEKGRQATDKPLLACPETFPKKGRFSDLQVSMTAPLVAPVLKKKIRILM